MKIFKTKGRYRVKMMHEQSENIFKKKKKNENPKWNQKEMPGPKNIKTKMKDQRDVKTEWSRKKKKDNECEDSAI